MSLCLLLGRSSSCAVSGSSARDLHEDKSLPKRQLLLNVVHAMKAHGVLYSEVFNIDETSCYLQPTPDWSWWFQKSAEKARWGGFKQQVTVTFVSRAAAVSGGASESAGSTLLHQVVFQGKTGAVHPGGSYVEGQIVAHSATHWATEDTLMTLLEAISDLCGGEHFLIVLDVAPKHTSALFCDRVRAEMPNAHLVFVPAGTTAWNQPLDIGHMRSWKSHLQSMPVMRVDLMPLLAQACRAVACEDHTKAWEHLVVNDEDEFDWLAAEASQSC